MSELPFVDEYDRLIAGPPERVWDALLRVVDGSFKRPGAARFARVLGAEPASPSGPRPLGVGATIVGFRVVESTPPRTLTLEGMHRFSAYRLAFLLEDLGPTQTRVRAQTWAAFPGPLGRAYRAMVIGTRMHRIVVERMLGAIERAALRP